MRVSVSGIKTPLNLRFKRLTPLGAEGALGPLALPPQGPNRGAEGAMGPWALDPLATRSVA